MRVEQIATQALKKMKDDRYKLALVVAKRAEELANGAEALVNLDKNKYKYTDIALYEIAEDKIALEGFIETSK